MDLQTIALLVAISSPVVMTGVAWGAATARLRALERDRDRHEGAISRAHSRIDAIQGKA
jgi:hypothetical protein